ncbi:MAG: hypothetical protein M3T56_18350 [Chloroflexota bacterium]|nr:hypothetical protein [Chloroflexota bacterium]
MRRFLLSGVLVLAGGACSITATPTSSPPAPTPAAPNATPTPVSAAPTATTTRPTIDAPTLAPERVLTDGTTLSVDFAAGQAGIRLNGGQNPAVANKDVLLRIDTKTRMTVADLTSPDHTPKIVTSFRDLGLKVGDSVEVTFSMSSYDPTTRTYLLTILERYVER